MRVCTFITAFALFQITTQPATQPIDADGWSARIPHLTTAVHEPRAFEVLGRYGDVRGARFRVTRVGDDWAMLLEQTADGTPILIAAERQALVYDALDGRLIHLIDVRPQFQVRQEGARLVLNIGLETREDEAAYSGIDIDCRSLFKSDDTALTLEKGPAGLLWLLGRSRGGGISRALIDSSLPQPIARIDALKDGREPPVFSVESFATGDRVDEEHVRFPAIESYHDMLGDGGKLTGPEAMHLFERVAITVALRPTLNNRALRGEIEASLGISIDWEEVERTDELFARQLRDIRRQGAASPIDEES